LFERAGLEDVSVTTPGVLDVNIVQNAAKKDPAILEDQRFIRNLFASDETAASFQEFLSENLLSSHTWVFGKKPL
jgi:hypothetical protein